MIAIYIVQFLVLGFIFYKLIDYLWQMFCEHINEKETQRAEEKMLKIRLQNDLEMIECLLVQLRNENYKIDTTPKVTANGKDYLVWNGNEWEFRGGND